MRVQTVALDLWNSLGQRAMLGQDHESPDSGTGLWHWTCGIALVRELCWDRIMWVQTVALDLWNSLGQRAMLGQDHWHWTCGIAWVRELCWDRIMWVQTVALDLGNSLGQRAMLGQYHVGPDSAVESLEQRENRLKQERDRASTSRAAESLEQQRDRASTSRAAESVGQRENRLRQNRNRGSTSRAAETPQEHTARILNVRERTFASRNSRDRLSNFLLEGFNYDSCKNYEQHPSITIGQMSIVCNYCKAKKYRDEHPGFCCKNGKVYLSPPQLPPDELLSLMSGNSSESNHF
ncbi:hypothetical protein LAZ67_21000776 [Cordylochernes scorpioides]|uniref:Uncharacterized protein n=1 Tax=Cordylochernes scorpioides TaxID=51811 RepID=A0ABY6LLP0_9ARAC|nr:hypothetical protein LAZ67_21000776 [Cordylochernes scorpioides]